MTVAADRGVGVVGGADAGERDVAGCWGPDGAGVGAGEREVVGCWGADGVRVDAGEHVDAGERVDGDNVGTMFVAARGGVGVGGAMESGSADRGAGEGVGAQAEDRSWLRRQARRTRTR